MDNLVSYNHVNDSSGLPIVFIGIKGTEPPWAVNIKDYVIPADNDIDEIESLRAQLPEANAKIAELEREATEEPHLISYGIDLESCTLLFEGEPYFFRRYSE